MKTQQLTLLITAISIIFIAFGCSESPITPTKKNHPRHPGHALSQFAPVAVTISGIGSGQMTASARSVSGLPTVASSISRPGDNSGGHDQDDIGTIQMKPLSNGSFTYGQRGSGGVRYLYATFKVRNADTSSVAYSTPRKNLTFIAADIDEGTLKTYGHTAITTLRLFDGSRLHGQRAIDIARQMIPTGQVSLNGASQLVSTAYDVLQVYTEKEANNIAAATHLDNQIHLFPYGFITRNPSTPGSRTLQKNPGENEYAGRVTFAFKLPLRPQANQDPFEITAMFLPVDQSNTRITQAPQEQTKMGREALDKRIEALNADSIIVLPGSKFKLSDSRINLKCAPVRIAGEKNHAITTLQPDSVNKISTVSSTSGMRGDEIVIRGCNLAGEIHLGVHQADIISNNGKKLIFKIPEELDDGEYEIKIITQENTKGIGTLKVGVFADGLGTQGDPYQVATLTQLQQVGNYLDAYFIQTQDIDASSTVGWNNGKGFNPIGGNGKADFTGNYNGNGHNISGLTIDRPKGFAIGLFGEIGTSGTVTGVHLNGGTISGSEFAGNLAGRNAGTIDLSSAGGTIRTDAKSNSNEYITFGGLTGQNEGTIKRSYATGNVVAGKQGIAGGLTGENYQGTIENSYAAGNVTGGSGNGAAGGLVGQNYGGIIKKSYAVGYIDQSSIVIGGLVGENQRNGIISNSYWDIYSTGLDWSDGSDMDHGLETSEMKGYNAPGNMGGFNFSSVWQIVVNPKGYPILRDNPPQNQ